MCDEFGGFLFDTGELFIDRSGLLIDFLEEPGIEFPFVEPGSSCPGPRGGLRDEELEVLVGSFEDGDRFINFLPNIEEFDD